MVEFHSIPGLQAAYSLPVTLIAIAILLITSCSHDNFDSIINEENEYSLSENLPVPGNGGIISTSSITDEGLQLAWSKASDPSTAQAELEYRVYRSGSNNIATPSDAEANGTPLDTWVRDISSMNVGGLDSATVYYFNVIVKSADDRKAAYSSVMAVTLGTVYLYSVGPFPGNLTAQSGPPARADIDGRCLPIPVAGPAQARAFISINVRDKIQDFTTAYGVPSNWPVRGAAGQRIAWNWADLLDGSINMKLADAGITSAPWWSGSTEDGDFDTGASCGNWTVVNNTSRGRTGSHDSITGSWIYDAETYCFYAQRLLCIAW